MGKGSGCFPSKNKKSLEVSLHAAPLSHSQRSIPFEGQTPISNDVIAPSHRRVATSDGALSSSTSQIHHRKVATSDGVLDSPTSQTQHHRRVATLDGAIAPVQDGGLGRVKKKLKVFIVFYSMYRHVEALARKIKKGVDGVEGVEGILYRVPEILAPQVLEQMKVPLKDDGIPIISVEELVEADGLLFGFPTRYGSMAAQMKAFFDSTGSLWREQKLAGVPAGFFVSTGTQGGGQETTAWTAITQLAHHGMLYVPIGYTFGAGMFGTDSIRGGSPYGAGVFSGDGTREPSETELDLAQHQGKYMALIVKRYTHPHSFAPK